MAVGGLIGALSSITTLFVSYFLEGMRLRRQWAREDRLQMRANRQVLQNVLSATEQQAGASQELKND